MIETEVLLVFSGAHRFKDLFWFEKAARAG